MSPDKKESSKAPGKKPGRWKRIAKRLVVAIVAFFVLGLVGGNLFLATPVGRGFVAKKMSRAMKMPVEVGSASYTPWGGLKVRDLRVEQVGEAKEIVAVPFFEAASFEAHVNLFSLLTKEVKVTRLVCESPKVSIVRRKKAEGEKLTRSETGETDPGTVDQPPPQVVEGEQPERGDPARPQPSSPRRPERESVEKGRTVSIGEVVVRGGSFTLSDHVGETLLSVEGLEMSFDFSEVGKSGRLEFDEAVLLGGLRVKGVESPLEFLESEEGWLELADLRGECEGGEVRGKVQFAPRKPGKPFVAQLFADGVEIAGLAKGRADGLRSGVVSGKLALRGFATRPDLASGAGSFSIDSLILTPGKVSEKVRDALAVGPAGEVDLDPARASFLIDKGDLILRDASFGSGRVLVRSLGEVSRKGALNVAARLYVDADLHSGIRSKSMSERGALVFEPLEGSDWFYRDELVSGTFKDPRVDLWRTGEPLPLAEVVKELSIGFEPQEIEPGAIGSR